MPKKPWTWYVKILLVDKNFIYPQIFSLHTSSTDSLSTHYLFTNFSILNVSLAWILIKMSQLNATICKKIFELIWFGSFCSIKKNATWLHWNKIVSSKFSKKHKKFKNINKFKLFRCRCQYRFLYSMIHNVYDEKSSYRVSLFVQQCETSSGHHEK